MFSLSFSFIYINFLFFNNLIFFFNLCLFLIFFLTGVFYIGNLLNWQSTLISLLKMSIISIFITLLNLLIYKYYIYFYIKAIFTWVTWLKVTHTLPILFIYSTELTILGDTIILLCLIVSLLCWVILGERFIFKNYLNLGYFLIFILFTANMVYTSNLFILFLFFEFIFLPSLYFVYISGYAKKVDKSIKFLLLWTFCGSLAVLLGLVYVYSLYSSLSFKFLQNLSFTPLENTALSLLFFFGFGVKLPLWPFHYWLTKVHVEAPAGFSIFLSGFLVKTALYCIYYFYLLFTCLSAKVIMISVVLWGVVDASCRMWSVIDIKRLIALATIQEMNLILLFLLLSVNTSYLLLNLFILVHGILSALFFFLVDQIQKRFQTRNIFCLGGLAVKLTILPAIIWVSLLIFRGFPIFIKFFIEWELLILLSENFFFFGVLFFIFINIFAVLGFSRVFLIILYGTPRVKIISWTEMLKKDLNIAIFLLSILFLLNFSLLLF